MVPAGAHLVRVTARTEDGEPASRLCTMMLRRQGAGRDDADEGPAMRPGPRASRHSRAGAGIRGADARRTLSPAAAYQRKKR